MKRYRIEGFLIDQDDDGDEKEVGEYAQEALEEGLGTDFKVEGLAVYEVML
ncbi:hypothetical protein [Mycobacterium intracellulare]|uniref:Uncharacterized protein n=1 Tax=Mycobacterium intracellulare TaxID=1767 RepID=A0A7R7MYS1_MYCIT|nr:hypothetical protein [Mycobacterium intracellulare]BCP02476.1 hypothetical protein MINTM018_52450 [Mycobacterium intracellulare]